MNFEDEGSVGFQFNLAWLSSERWAGGDEIERGERERVFDQSGVEKWWIQCSRSFVVLSRRLLICFVSKGELGRVVVGVE